MTVPHPVTAADTLCQALHGPTFRQRRESADAVRRRPGDHAVLWPVLGEALRHADADVRRRAVLLVPALAPPAEETAALVRALADPAWRVRRAAAQALASRADEVTAAVGPLVTALADADAAVREAAAEALAPLRGGVPARVVSALAAALADPDEAVRETAAAALDRVGLGGVDAVGVLVAALGDDQAGVRRHAARLLGRSGAAASRAVPSLSAALSDADRSVRHAAAAALSSVADEAAAGPLLAALGDVREVRAQAARTLAALARKSPDVEAQLLEALDDPAPRRRRGAALALGELGSAAAVRKLRDALGRREPRHRRRALLALACFAGRGESLRPDLERGLTDSHAKVRAAAVEALGTLAAEVPGLLPLLIRRCHDRDRRVREAGARAVVRCQIRLPAERADWLALLAGPSPETRLHQALGRADVMEGVRQEFAAACRRRIRWHLGAGFPDVGEGATVAELARLAADAAARKATHGVAAAQRESVAAAAREAEHVWGLALLWGLRFPAGRPGGR
jgi:HEAT repeat protein